MKILLDTGKAADVHFIVGTEVGEEKYKFVNRHFALP